MNVLPELPGVFPQLDFAAVEGLRQSLVHSYREMLGQMQQAIGAQLEAEVEPILKSTGTELALDKQNARRQKIVYVLKRLGVPESACQAGGKYEHFSDNALRDEAKRLLAEARAGAKTAK